MEIAAAFLFLGLAVFFIRLLIKPKPPRRPVSRPALGKTRPEAPKGTSPRRPAKKTALPPKLSLEDVKKIKHRTIMQQVAFQDPGKLALLIKMALKDKDFKA